MGALMTGVIDRAELAGILSRMHVGKVVDTEKLHAASEHAAALVIEALPRLREEFGGIAPPVRDSELAYRFAKLGCQYRDEWLEKHG